MTRSSPGLLDRFDDMRDAIRADVVDRDEETHGLLVALVANLHILFLGPPGVAKSYLIDRTFARISGVKYGKWPLHRLMSVDDLFGPLDIRAYAEDGRWRRILDGYLADCDYCNLEEIFKASPSTLGMLLSSLNERVVRNDGKIVPIPLKMMACSSNELAKDEGTAPLYDRIPLRYHVQPPPDKASMQKMLDLDPCDLADIEPILTGEQIVQAHKAALALPFAPAVSEKMTELYFDLHERHGIRPTPRRLAWTRRAMQAEAWLDGSDVVAVEHLSIGAHTLWDLPAQIDDVQAAVVDIANPQERQIMDLLKGTGEIRSAIPTAAACTDEEEKQARGMEIYHKIRDASKVLEDIMAAGGTGRRQRDLVESCRASLHEVLVEMITRVMDLPLSEIHNLGLPKLTGGAA